MRLKNPLLALFVGLCAYWLCCGQSTLAVPTNCDNKCRKRQYFYLPQLQANPKYRKYREVTCELCWGPGAICTIDVNDTKVDSVCWTPPGMENKNEFWQVTSQTVCGFTTELSIEAKAAEPPVGAKSIPADLKDCK